ncbi:hypothetical protein [Arthrobacter ulcerisalmonis]|uniref:hypothetical protein n=1 Tax=Arthrobacter ulcerisalmonis TaxID=2483813 RepID=UPI0031F3FA86
MVVASVLGLTLALSGELLVPADCEGVGLVAPEAPGSAVHAGPLVAGVEHPATVKAVATTNARVVVTFAAARIMVSA